MVAFFVPRPANNSIFIPMKKTEIILIFLSLLGIGLSLFLIPGHSTILTFSMLTLAFLYLAFSFLLFNNIRLRHIFKASAYAHINPWRIIGAVVAGIALSSTIAALLFVFEELPENGIMLLSAVLQLSLVTVTALVFLFRAKSRLVYNVLKRALPIGVIPLLLLIAPANTWLYIKYRNCPNYVEALKAAEQHPESDALKEAVIMNRMKCYER